MENFKLTLIGIGSVLLLIFAVVAALMLSDTPGSSDNNSSTNSTTAATAATTTKAPETTPVTTKPQTTTPVTTKAPETTTFATEPLEWGEEAFSATMYVNQSCYSRIKALMGSETVKQYTYGEAVNVVAKTDTGYYKLNDGEYIHGDYLSETEL